MEKYTKWDDPSNGLNPFTPLIPKSKLYGISSILRSLITVFFLLIRVPCVIIVFVIYTTLHAAKFFLLVPALIRLVERFLDYLCGKMLLSVSSYNRVNIEYHKEDDAFDFVKF